MKILLLVKEIQNDIASSGVHLKNASKEGYQIADRTSRIYNQSQLRRYYNITRSVSDKVLSNTTKKELPYLGCALGMLIPIPLMSPILFLLGFLARISPNGASIIYNKTSQTHHMDIK